MHEKKKNNNVYWRKLKGEINRTLYVCCSFWMSKIFVKIFFFLLSLFFFNGVGLLLLLLLLLLLFSISPCCKGICSFAISLIWMTLFLRDVSASFMLKKDSNRRDVSINERRMNASWRCLGSVDNKNSVNIF